MAYRIRLEDIELLDACPVCEGKEFKRISTIYVGTLPFFTTDFCKSCGFVFRRKRPLFSWRVKSYQLCGKTLKQFWFFSENLEKRRYSRYANLAQALEGITGGRKVIDIGTGPGTGLKAFHDRGWDVTGLEPQPVLAKVGRERYGLNIVESWLEEYVQTSESHDLATVIHTLEHLYDPYHCLESVARLVKEDGYIYIEVPELGNEKWQDSLHLSHLNIFTEETLVFLASRVGLKPHYRLYPRTKPRGSVHLGILFKKENYNPNHMNEEGVSNLLNEVKGYYANGLPEVPNGIIKIRVPEINNLGITIDRKQKSLVCSKSGKLFYFANIRPSPPPTLLSRLIEFTRVPPKILVKSVLQIARSKLTLSRPRDTEDEEFPPLKKEHYPREVKK